MKKITFLTLLLAAGAVLSAAPTAAQKKALPVRVVAERVKLEQNTEVRRYVGHVEAIDAVKIPARVSGFLLKTHFLEGDMVKKNQLLYEIEDTSYRAKAEQAAAQVTQAQALLDYARIDYERQKELRATKAVSQAVYDESQRVLRTAEATLANAKAVKLEADNNLSYTKVYAPFDGLIGKSIYSNGQYVTPSSNELAEVVMLSPIYVHFAMSERDYLEMFGDYKTMQKNGVTRYRLADNREYSLPGKVQFIDNHVDENTGTITVWSVVENPKIQLLPGGFATVMLSNKNAPVMASVKLSSIMADSSGNYVYVVNAKNKIELRYVQLSNVIGRRQFIKSGLKTGEIVVTDGTNRVSPGSDVVPVFPPKK